jgi:hypothetical protein
MPRHAPLVDRTVAKSPVIGVAGLLLALAAIGLVILAARSGGNLLRGLDQSAIDRIAAEPPPE